MAFFKIFLAPLLAFSLWYNLLMWTLIYSLVFILFSAIYSLVTAYPFQNISLESLLGKIHNVFTSQWDSEEVLTLKKAWAQIILPCFTHRQLYQKVWEFPFLAILSFYTLMKTRFHLIEVFIISRGLLVLLLFGEGRVLLVYSEPVLVMTLLASLPVFKQHFAKVYSPNLFKMLGWNTVTKILLSQAKTGAKVAAVVVGVWGIGEIVSPFIGEIRADRYVTSVNQANELTVKVNTVLKANGQAAAPLQPLDGAKYVALRETSLVREGINIFKEVAPYMDKGKLPPKKKK